MKILGMAMLAALMGAVFSLPIVVNRDWKAAFVIFGATMATLAWILIAVYLLNGGTLE